MGQYIGVSDSQTSGSSIHLTAHPSPELLCNMHMTIEYEVSLFRLSFCLNSTQSNLQQGNPRRDPEVLGQLLALVWGDREEGGDGSSVSPKFLERYDLLEITLSLH